MVTKFRPDVPTYENRKSQQKPTTKSNHKIYQKTKTKQTP